MFGCSLDGPREFHAHAQGEVQHQSTLHMFQQAEHSQQTTVNQWRFTGVCTPTLPPSSPSAWFPMILYDSRIWWTRQITQLLTRDWMKHYFLPHTWLFKKVTASLGQRHPFKAKFPFPTTTRNMIIIQDAEPLWALSYCVWFCLICGEICGQHW